MFIRFILLLSFLAFTGSVSAQDDSELKQILDMLQEMSQENAELKERIEKLESGKSATTANIESSDGVENTTKQDGVDRVNGWLAAVHVVEGKGRRATEKGILGRIEIDGFPMKHGIYTKDIDTNSAISYRGAGELKIEESGDYTFSMYLTASKGYPTCRFQMDIEGNSIFNVQDTGQIKAKDSEVTRTWAESIELDAGFYKWELSQYCGNISTSDYDTITWDLRVLAPTARNAVSTRNNYIFYRE